MSKAAPRVIALLGDLHVGGTGALMPPNFRTLQGVTLGQSPAQEFLWDCWELMLKQLYHHVGKDAFSLVLMGDLIEGNHHRTKEIASVEESDHFRAAVHILKPLAKRAHSTFVIEGTECHTHEYETAIGEKIGARVNPETGLPVFGRLALDVCGVRMVARHHMPTSTRSYMESTPMAPMMGNEIIECTRRGETPPRVLAMAHSHKARNYTDGTHLTLVSHAWQMLTRHGRKVVPSASVRPGVWILDWRGLPNGSLPHPYEYAYQAPPQTACTL